MAESIRLDQESSIRGYSAADQAVAEFNADKDRLTAPGFTESFKTAVQLDHTASNLMVLGEHMHQDSLPSVPQMDAESFKQKWTELSKDHTPEEQDALLNHAGNWDAMVRTSREIKDRNSKEKSLAKAGWVGTGARVLASLTDPVAIAAGIASDGLAAPWIYGSKASKAATLGRAAVAGAASNVALEGVNAAAQGNYNENNLLVALGTGGALGALTGHLGTKIHPTVDHEVQLQHAMSKLAIEASPKSGGIRDLISETASRHGIDPNTMLAIAQIESKLNPKAHNPSGASGLFQFMPGTAKQYGLADPFDAAANADAAARLLLDNQKTLTHSLGRNPTVGELYLAHQQGAGGALKLLSNPDGLATSTVGKQAVLQNGGHEGMTNAEFANLWARKADGLSGAALPDSVGAMRNQFHTEGVHSILEDDTAPFDALVGTKSKFSSVNKYGTGSFLNNDNPVMKYIGKNFLSDGIEGGEDAALHVDMTNHFFASRWGSEHHSAFQEYSKMIRDQDIASGVEPNLFRKVTGLEGAQVRKEFDKMIALEQRGVDTGVPAAKRMAKRMGDDSVEILRSMKAAGVAGVDEIVENGGYLTRQWKPHMFRELSNQYSDETVKSLLKGSIKSSTPDIEDELLNKLTGAIYNRMRNKAAGIGDEGVFHQPLFGKDNKEALNDFLDMIDPRHEEVDIRKDVEDWFNSADATKRDQSGAASANFKIRIDLDEKFSMQVTDRQGNTKTLNLYDLLENDATKLHTGYIRQMSGHIAMAKMGVKGNKEWKVLMNHLERYGDQLGHDRASIQSSKANAEMVRNLILGKPVDQWVKHPGMAEFLQANRDVAFTRMMGQVGLASVTELGTIASSVGLKAMLAHSDNLRMTLTGMADGTVHPETPLFKELESMFGSIGTGYSIHPPKLVETDAGVTASRGRQMANDVMTSLQAAKRTVSTVSGHHAVTSNLERLAFTGIAQKFLDTAYGSKWNPKRLAYLGLDDKMTERVLSQIKTHATHEPNAITGRKLLTLGHDKWTDYQALEAFQMATYREARRIVQQNLLGEAPLFLSTELGKTLFQFRGFQLAAFTKNTLHNLHMMDSETLANVMYGTFVGAMTYSLQTTLNAQGREDQDSYLKKHMSTEAIAKGAFAKAGFSSLLPGVYDSVLPTVTGGLFEAQFNNTRSSGLASSFFAGNPSVANLQSLGGAAQGITGLANPNYKLSKDDIRNTVGLLAGSNTYGVRNAMNLLMADLPNHSLKQKQDK